MADTIDNQEQTLLTTVDNPYNPFTEFDKWFAFDSSKGYNTCGLVERLLISAPELSDADQRLALKDAQRRALELNLYGVHKIVTEKSFDS